MERPVRRNVRNLVVMAALLLTTAFMPEQVWAQRGGSRSGGGGRSGGGQAVGRAVPRGTTGGHRGTYVSGPRYYRPVYVTSPYWGIGWGWGGYGYWGPGWWGPGYASSLWWPGWGWWGGPALYAPPYAAWGVTSDARLLVKPRNTEVYVDGALAGVVDQYDGVFQSLRLAPGTHRISLYLDGHKRFDTNVYVAPASTLKVRHTMEPLAEGAAADPRPEPVTPPQPEAGATAEPGPEPAAAPGEPAPMPPPQYGDRGGRAVAGDAALLVIRVQPSDAEIFIDGQRWQVPDGTRPLEVRVPAGRVKLDVRRPGYAPYSTELTVQPGEVTPINVSLPSRGAPI